MANHAPREPRRNEPAAHNHGNSRDVRQRGSSIPITLGREVLDSSCGLVRSLALTVLLVSAASVPAQPVGKTTSFRLRSAMLNEDRAFQVYVPVDPAPKAAVIYVLDGQAQFTTVVNALTAL